MLGAVQTYRWAIWTFGADTGTFSQIILDTFGGFRDGPEAGTHFRFHWSPIIGVLYPLLALVHSALVLQYAQIALIALSAFALHAIVRPYASLWLATACGVLPLIYPPLVAVAFNEFHEIGFYPAIALALFWSADRERWGWFAALALASALVREDCCIVLACIGLALAVAALVRRRSARRGLLLFEPRSPAALAVAGCGLAAVNACALLVYFLAVIPHVGSWQPSHFYDYPFAYGPLAVAAALVLHPGVFPQVFTYAKAGYLLEAFVPVAFMPLRSAWTLLAVPGFAILLLSSEWGAFRMGSHYAAIWIPWLLLGTAAALVDLERRGAVRFSHRAFAAVAALCALFIVAIDPAHPAHFLRVIYPHAGVRSLMARVPRDASVLTHDEWFAETAIDHPFATIFPYTEHEYVLVADNYPNGFYERVIRPELLAQIASGRAHEIARMGSVVLYRLVPKAPRTSR